MAHLPDLSAGGYGGYPGVWSVGWLDAPHPFPTGDVPPELLVRLDELLRAPWAPEWFMGGHTCTLCGAAGPYGYRNLFVPDRPGGRIFMAPELILHYIRDHRYRPPDVFVEAVRSCPPMRSEAYARALFECSPRLFPPGGPLVVDGAMVDW